jgi:CDP-paratose 2-epimerase
MKVLVTGADGFIGRHLCRRLSADHEVVGIDKATGVSTADWPELERVMLRHHPTFVVHLGANCSSQRSLRDPAADFWDNTAGTFNVCEAARLWELPVVYTSTMKVNPGGDRMVTPYGMSKLVGELYLQMYAELYGVHYAVNRPSSVYGPGQDGTADGGWVTHFIRCAAAGKPIDLWVDPSNSRDVLYVDDYVDLLIDQVEHFDAYVGNTYNVGGGPDNELSIQQLLDCLRYHNTRRVPGIPGDIRRVVNDNQVVHAVRSWVPRVGWKEGVDRTMEWVVGGVG